MPTIKKKKEFVPPKSEHPLANCEPLGDRVVVLRDNTAGKTTIGIIIPDAAQGKEQMGLVVSVGPGKRRDDGVLIPMILEPGDRVLFSSYAGLEIQGQLGSINDPYLILREEDVVAKIPE